MSRAVVSVGAGLVLGGVLSASMIAPALADKIKHPVAIFSGLDKITGRIITFEVKIDETVRFGALQITPRVCYTRPITESPNTTAFVQVDEVTLDNEIKPLFSGWMFASSPGLHGVEHPVYDAWLKDCKGGATLIPDAKPGAPAAQPGDAQQPQAAPPASRQRPARQPARQRPAPAPAQPQ